MDKQTDWYVFLNIPPAQWVLAAMNIIKVIEALVCIAAAYPRKQTLTLAGNSATLVVSEMIATSPVVGPR